MRRARLVTLMSALAATLLAGCGLVSSSGTFHDASLPGGERPLDGAKLVVMSKSFTEGVLLGKITATYLAAAGASVTRLTDDLMRELNGRVDIDGEDPADVAYD
jgi:osmoprotectant transport system substrate-binding protein